MDTVKKKEEFKRINIYKGQTYEERAKNWADLAINYINRCIEEGKEIK